MLLQWKFIASGFLIIITKLLVQVKAHGRLIEPPSRASMWRYETLFVPHLNEILFDFIINKMSINKCLSSQKS